ncbi:unnamed protein product [Calypogeia fissa]
MAISDLMRERISHELSSKKLLQQQLAASLSTQAGVGDSVSGARRLLLRTRSDGVLGDLLLQQQGLRRAVEDTNKVLEKRAERSKNYKKAFEKNTETPSDRRKGLDRRSLDKKSITETNSRKWDKSSNVQKKPGVITILRRPQTKEAAAENIALFTGRPIEDVTKQILKSAQHAQVEVELPKNVEFRGKDGEMGIVQSKSSRNSSLKKGTKRKPSQYISGKAASRAAAAAEGAQAESRRSQDAELHGESRRSKTAPRPGDGAPVEWPRFDDVEPYSDECKKDVEVFASAEQDVEEIVKELETIWRDLNISHVSPASVDEIGPSRSSEYIIPRDCHWGSDSLIGEIGQAFTRQGTISRIVSVQDVSHGNDSSGELLFLPSSPPKPSERWAGAAYTNSPPPCTLPFPRFPLQRMKTSMTEVTLADVALQGPDYRNLETMSFSAPPSPTRMASLFFSATAMETPSVDPSSATKDLRRMLNLDVEDSIDVTAEWSEGSVESATQSLKRMLQL